MSPLARDEFVAYLAAPADKTRPCIRTTATTFVKCLGSSAVSRSLEKSTFDLCDLLNNKPMTIYLVLPPEKLLSHRALLRLWVVTLMTVVMRRTRLPKQRTLFLLDEAAQLGSLDLLPQAVRLLPRLRVAGLDVLAGSESDDEALPQQLGGAGQQRRGACRRSACRVTRRAIGWRHRFSATLDAQLAASSIRTRCSSP